MSSSWQTFVDAVMADLTTNVPGLRDVREHRYSPWDPEDQVAEVGERHLACYPVAGQPMTAERAVTGPGGDLWTMTYRITYWEHAGDESARGISDEEAAADLLALAETTTLRFYAIENVRLGGADYVSVVGAALPERSGQVRWFAIGVQARQFVVAT